MELPLRGRGGGVIGCWAICSEHDWCGGGGCCWCDCGVVVVVVSVVPVAVDAVVAVVVVVCYHIFIPSPVQPSASLVYCTPGTHDSCPIPGIEPHPRFLGNESLRMSVFFVVAVLKVMSSTPLWGGAPARFSLVWLWCGGQRGRSVSRVFTERSEVPLVALYLCILRRYNLGEEDLAST